MVPGYLLLEHIKALVAVWVIVLLAGIPTSTLLRVRLGFPGYVLVGILYWTLSLYLFCFDNGLLVALGIVVVCLIGIVARREPLRMRTWRREHFWTAVILVLGCAVYASVTIRNYVPPGVDAGMVATSSRVISNHQGLPATYDPWFPELFFPTINLSLPTIGSLAIGIGCEPGSTTLALAQLCYSAWILAAYVVLRLWTRPATAAVLAVAQAWGSRWAQNTIGWGGFTTVAGMAMGLFALRLMWDASRRGGWRSILALGLTTGSIPLIHGVSAAVWMYIAAPVAAIALMVQSTRPVRTLGRLALAAGISALVLGLYLLLSQLHLSQEEIDWSRDHLAVDAPETGSLSRALPKSFHYLQRYGGTMLSTLGAASLIVLFALGRWRSALAVLASLILLLLVIANARWWLLPFSLMLYPNRAVYWGGPLSAIATALALQAIRHRWPGLTRIRFLRIGLSVLVLGAMLVEHIGQYQRHVMRPAVGRDGWEMLQWAKANLQEQGTFVKATYGSVGTYLPSHANVPSSAWQIHHCAMEEIREIFHRRQPTHQLVVRGVDPEPASPARVVFENASVRIFELRSPP